MKIKECLLRVWQWWLNFWFAPQDLFKVSAFRVVFGATLFVMYAIRFCDFKTFYSNEGLMPASGALDIVPELYRSPVHLFFYSDVANYWAYIAFLVGIFLLTTGLIGRSLTWVVWLLHLSFLQRNFAVVYGADLFSNFWLLYLSFIRHNQHLSLWNLIRPNPRPMTIPVIDSDMVSSAFVRLLQVQLCISYAYTGIEKLKGLQWWEGTAVWYTLGMRELVSLDLTFLRDYPVIIGLLAMIPLLFEVYFPFGVVIRKLRTPWLVMGFFFHLGTALIMGLWFFCLVMTSTYFIFLDSRKLRNLVRRLTGLF